MKVTLKDIAREAEVSEGTASLALNNRPGVNSETRKRIQEIALRCGYHPSRNATFLVKKHSNLIGLLIPNIRNLFYSNVVQSIESELQNLGYQMILATTTSNEKYEKEMVERFVSFQVDGVIVYPIIKDNHNPFYLDILRKNGIPLVFLGSYYPSIDAPYCMSDLYGGISEVVKHMYEHNSRKFKYFGATRTIVSNQIKINAMKHSLKHFGLIFYDEDYIAMESTNYDCAFLTTKNLLKNGKSFDSAITGDAYSAFGVLNALLENGLRVPQDVAIAHLGNIIKPEISKLPMTCIEQNVPEIVRSLISMLMLSIEGKEKVNNILIPTKLIIRESTLR